jgi:hypothetical protein
MPKAVYIVFLFQWLKIDKSIKFFSLYDEGHRNYKLIIVQFSDLFLYGVSISMFSNHITFVRHKFRVPLYPYVHKC